MKQVYLGGTRDSKWRDELISMLKIDYFDPVEKDKDEVSEARGSSDFVLYVIVPCLSLSATDVVILIADAIQDSVRRPEKTVFCCLKEYKGVKRVEEDWLKAIPEIETLISENGSKIFRNLGEVARYLNQHYVEIQYHPDVVECLIERDGPTTISLGRSTYVFEKNDAGHYVCLVGMKEHRNYLTSLPDFRIYMKDKLPKPDLTDDDLDFIRQWKVRGPDQFQAFVNAKKNIDRFNRSSNKVRELGISKWKALLPNVECPIRPPDKERPPGVQSFIGDWLKLNADQFLEYVTNNQEAFKSCISEEIERAKDKWDRIVYPKTGKGWPIQDSTL